MANDLTPIRKELDALSRVIAETVPVLRKGIKIYEDNTPSNTNTQNKPNAY